MNKELNILRRLKPRVKLFTDFFVLDTETGKENKDGSINWHLHARPESFKLGVIYGHNYEKVFRSLEELKLELKTKRFKDKIVFIHNAQYDLSVMYGNIYDLDPESIFNGGKFICATNGICKFADSMNIYPTSVEKLGKMLGINKTDLGDQYFSPNGITKKEIDRCRIDCQIVWECLYQIFEDAGDMKMTQASLSLSHFRRYHQKLDIRYNELTKHFWNSYYGGRTEMFKQGKTHSSVIDINSSYPRAMKFDKFPNPQFFKEEKNISVKEFDKILAHYEGCVYCKIDHPDIYFGMLPIKSEGKLKFPVGIFSGCWNFNEIRFALKKGIKILSISSVIYAPPMDSIYVSYIDTLYYKRFKTNNRLEIFRIKIFMNSLYGKFASRIRKKEIYLKDYVKQDFIIQSFRKEDKLIKVVPFSAERKDAILHVKVSTKQFPYSIPSFASYITSSARVYLLDKMFEMQNNKITYVDTDSIFFELFNQNISDLGAGLGQWKLEDKIVTEIRSLKNYSVIEDGHQIDKIKGVPKDAHQILHDDDDEENDLLKFEYPTMIKAKESKRRNLDSGIQAKRTKKITGNYDKRIVLPNGETKPIKL